MQMLKNVHRDKVLNEEFSVPLPISVYKLSKTTSIPQTRFRPM